MVLVVLFLGDWINQDKQIVSDKKSKKVRGKKEMIRANFWFSRQAEKLRNVEIIARNNQVSFGGK